MSIDGMSKNDRDVLTAFEDRFATFKSLKPALADADFKKYFAEFISEMGILAAELKTKKKSLSRRSNKETDKFYISIGDLEDAVKDYTHFVKCYLYDV